jgi:histidyl-tRNA synthetase
MVAKKLNELAKPIRWFSIANFWRYEKPQRGRGREFFQLNADIFGFEGIEADFEVISLAIDLMKSFDAKEGMFEIRINDRKLMDDFYRKLKLNESQIKIVNKAIDKKTKISEEEFEEWLADEAKMSKPQLEKLVNFMENPYPTLEELLNEKSEGALELKNILNLIDKYKLNNLVKFSPSVIRGLDYYTGMVFEIFDLNPQNTRAIAGGGRYDNLINLFGEENLTGTGFAMGDITLQDFLLTWNLLPGFESECEYLVTLWPSEDTKFLEKTLEVSNILRGKGKNVSTWLEKNTKLDKQLKYADKKGFKYAVIIGENEIKKNTIMIKDMVTKNQSEIELNDEFSI